jgi:hypothetical protein
MEFTKEIEKLFNAEQIIDATEKNTLNALYYVQPDIVRSTLTDLSKANANFARANLAAIKSVQSFAMDSFEGFNKKTQKSTK